jgi:hypothetical protein
MKSLWKLLTPMKKKMDCIQLCGFLIKDFFTANWDGIYDNETGILGYSVTAGESVCEEKIKEHHDPHAHLFDRSQWTHSVMMTPLEEPYTVLPGLITM